MTLGKTLKALRTNKKLTQTQLADALGVSRSTISLYELDLREPDIQFLQRVSVYFTLSLDHLLDNKLEASSFAHEFQGKQVSEVLLVPVIGNVAAGNPAISMEDVDEYLPLPSSFVPDNRSVFALTIKGDSMIDIGINDGDIVLVKKQEFAENGQTVIARVNGNEMTCKRFYCVNNRVVLEPANNKYKTLEPQDVEIVGIVFKIIKNIY